MSNEEWSEAIVCHLLLQGVSYFCLSPGSRSASLTYAIAKNKQAKTMVHFDERGMAFHAFGYAKATKEPVALVVTSGTAVANLYPAIMSAAHERVPLIVITADRPPELRECGANQTADQVKIFSECMRWQVDLPCPDDMLTEEYLATTLSTAVYHATKTPSGPVHINCMYREPFFTQKVAQKQKPLFFTQYEKPVASVSATTLKSWSKAFSSVEKGLIVVGSLSSPSSHLLLNLAQKLQWPLFADSISGCRELGSHPCLIPYYDPLLKLFESEKPDLIVHFGDRFVSKPMQKWLEAKQYYQITDHPCRQDPAHQVTHRLEMDPALFCSALLPHLEQRESTPWQLNWQEKSELFAAHLASFFKEKQALSEPQLIYDLAKCVDSSCALFLANSMPIRDAEQFFFSKDPIGPIFANRGLSGIDGNIATAIGIAQGSGKPTLALLGDLAALHDINSLAQLKKAKIPVIFIVINNHGGGIFSFLPVAQKQDVFEEFFATAHPFDFEHAAKLFDLPYFCPKDLSEYLHIVAQAKSRSCSCLIEITTDRKQNYELHQEIFSSFSKELVQA